MAHALTRRAFLLGRSAAADSPFARVGTACLAHAGVVCQNCRDACEPGAVSFPMARGAIARPLIDPERCTACGECVSTCPAGAISLGEPPP